MKPYLKDFLKDFSDTNYILWFERLLNTANTIFTYENLPKTLDSHFLETYVRLSPLGISSLINDKLYGVITVRGGLGDDVSVYGMGTNFIGANTKKSYNININDDNIVLCKNNNSYLSDYNLIDKYAKILNEIDKSINSLTIYSRFYPMPLISDNKEYKQYADNFQKIVKGEMGGAMHRENKLNELSGVNSVEMVNITDVNASSKLECLTRLKDSILKDYLREIGITCNNMDKSAQVNTIELQAYDNYTNLNLYDYYWARVNFIDEANKKFGTNMKVSINEMLINQILRSNEQEGVVNESKEVVNRNDSELGSKEEQYSNNE